jgi:hypothetical protein
MGTLDVVLVRGRSLLREAVFHLHVGQLARSVEEVVSRIGPPRLVSAIVGGAEERGRRLRRSHGGEARNQHDCRSRPLHS